MKKEKTTSKKFSIWTYFFKYKWSMFLYAILLIADSVLSIVMTIAAAEFLTRITDANFDGAINVIWYLIGGVIIEKILNSLITFAFHSWSKKVVLDLSSDITKQTFLLSSATYSESGAGLFVERIVEDPTRLVSYISYIYEMIVSLISSVFVIVYIFTINYLISIAIIVLLVVVGIIEHFRIKFNTKSFKKVLKEREKVKSLTTEIIRSEMDIKSLGLESRLSEISRNANKNLRQAELKRAVVGTNIASIRSIILNCGMWLVLAFGIVLMNKNLLAMASFMFIYSNNSSLMRVVYDIGSLLNVIGEMKVSYGRIKTLFDNDEFQIEHFGERNLENVVGNIEFKNVNFTYKDYQHIEKKEGRKTIKVKTLVSEKKIFDELSFSIKPNTTVAFVGKSGSGKSTILNLMSKMYEVDSGEVLIDGVNINELSKDTIRSSISLVNQFPYIFDMTIKENLLLAKPDATQKEIEDAIKKSALDEFVKSLPDQLDTKVGENGIKLSGGLKQRLAIARALLKNSSIIIFDESTSSLDNLTQNEIKKSIDNLKGKSTIVIVAHRLTTIKDADHIYFLDEGKIVDQGTFEKLFKKNEKFKAMFLAENI